ncbi:MULTISPECIES: hypothetical protein [unclassified Thermotoga]|uniref:hypothetical protein n=1 Tax=unclassified Thermotoga TaxID=2631113 RepID=UPI000280E6ED|nr:MULTISPECIES: hypothetical protein [unclassified Thermotoga]AIY86495.1 hypothetical protein T2812B_04760 [Thermotoga sp. 2812B]EJX25936.1 hypothetical protein EMP_05396 [Thermotoga sp. EMP]
MKKVLAYFVIPVFIFIFITACGIKINSSNAPGSAVPAAGGEVLLKADLSNIIGSKSLSKANSGTGYHVAYVNLTRSSNNWDFYLRGETKIMEHFELEGTSLELSLEKDCVYVIGIFKETDQGIELVGLIGDPTSDLSSLPISGDAVDVIDLGTLRLENGILAPEISFSDFVEKLGFVDEEAIKQFGEYDITLKNFLNPDINRNGIFDDEEGIYWKEETWYSFLIQDPSDLEDPKPPIHYHNNSTEGDSIIIWINYKGHELDYELYTLTPCATLISPDGEPISPHNSGEIVEISKRIYQYYFNPRRVEKNTPIESGEYTLILHDKTENKDITLKFNWGFLEPTNQLGGMVYPIPVFEAYSDGTMKDVKIKWCFYSSQDEKVEPASDEIVDLIYKLFYAYLAWDIEGAVWYDIDPEPMEKGDYYTYSFPYTCKQLRTPYYFESGRMNLYSIGNNVVSVEGPITHTELPYGYETLTEWHPITSPASLVGIWYNHGFIREEGEYTVLVFQPDGTLEAFENWRGMMWNVPLNPTVTYGWKLEGNNLYISKDGESWYEGTVEVAFADDGREFIRLNKDGTELVYTNFYSYIRSAGNDLEERGVPFLRLKKVVIDSVTDGEVKWHIEWDGNYKWGLVNFDVYIGTSPDNMRLVAFLYEDYESMKEGIFSIQSNLREYLEPGTYFIKIVANTWKEIVESNVYEFSISY